MKIAQKHKNTKANKHVGTVYLGKWGKKGAVAQISTGCPKLFSQIVVLNSHWRAHKRCHSASLGVNQQKGRGWQWRGRTDLAILVMSCHFLHSMVKEPLRRQPSRWSADDHMCIWRTRSWQTSSPKNKDTKNQNWCFLLTWNYFSTSRWHAKANI